MNDIEKNIHDFLSRKTEGLTPAERKNGLELIKSCKPRDLIFKDDNGRTPLLLAIKNGHKEIAEYLISLGVNVSNVNKFYTNGSYAYEFPLKAAIEQGWLDIVEKILDRIKLSDLSKNRRVWAAYYSSELLITAANNARGDAGKIIFQTLFENLKSEASDKDIGYSISGSLESVINIDDKNLIYSILSYLKDKINDLKSEGRSKVYEYSYTNNYYDPILHAFNKNDEKLIDILLNLGFHPYNIRSITYEKNDKDKPILNLNNNPLMTALKSKKDKVFAQLLNYERETDDKNKVLFSLINQAIIENNRNILKLLFEYCTNRPSFMNDYGKSYFLSLSFSPKPDESTSKGIAYFLKLYIVYELEKISKKENRRQELENFLDETNKLLKNISMHKNEEIEKEILVINRIIARTIPQFFAEPQEAASTLQYQMEQLEHLHIFNNNEVKDEYLKTMGLMLASIINHDILESLGEKLSFTHDKEKKDSSEQSKKLDKVKMGENTEKYIKALQNPKSNESGLFQTMIINFWYQYFTLLQIQNTKIQDKQLSTQPNIESLEETLENIPDMQPQGLYQYTASQIESRTNLAETQFKRLVSLICNEDLVEYTRKQFIEYLNNLDINKKKTILEHYIQMGKSAVKFGLTKSNDFEKNFLNEITEKVNFLKERQPSPRESTQILYQKEHKFYQAGIRKSELALIKYFEDQLDQAEKDDPYNIDNLVQIRLAQLGALNYLSWLLQNESRGFLGTGLGASYSRLEANILKKRENLQKEINELWKLPDEASLKKICRQCFHDMIKLKIQDPKIKPLFQKNFKSWENNNYPDGWKTLEMRSAAETKKKTIKADKSKKSKR